MSDDLDTKIEMGSHKEYRTLLQRHQHCPIVSAEDRATQKKVRHVRNDKHEWVFKIKQHKDGSADEAIEEYAIASMQQDLLIMLQQAIIDTPAGQKYVNLTRDDAMFACKILDYWLIHRY